MASTGSILAASVAGTIPATIPIAEDTPRPKMMLLKDKTSSRLPKGIKLRRYTSRIPEPPPIKLKQIASKRNWNRMK
jgi:hypothetical protein